MPFFRKNHFPNPLPNPPQLPPKCAYLYAPCFRTLRDGEERQARDRHGKGSGQREVRIPLLSPAAGLHRRGVQGRAENPAEKSHGVFGF